ncbi:uncharacterized protein LOC117104942 [Anneissia japonica]|uniref:uncharacterized protein LOC117104942 n=1 Tax=Anneissia japonica TaxID=1529436 RepID=UPI0014259ACB|nr:uncharacterized protein LOC117104942 [Anneissia japonica]
MPNSGFQGQINNKYCGTSKGDILPVGEKYYQGNLPNPAFWRSYVSSAPLKSSLPPLDNRYSRHLNLTSGGLGCTRLISPPRSEADPNSSCSGGIVPKGGIMSNSVAPFATLGKATCGYFFSRETDHKKRLTGIPPANLVMWRYYVK